MEETIPAVSREAGLVVRMIQDDEEAFDALMERYYPQLVRMAYLISGNYADSEDIVQDTFVTCYCSRKKIKEPAHFDHWIYKTLTRVAWRYCKKHGREQPVEAVYEDNAPDRGSVWDEVVRGYEYRELYQAVKALPVKQRTAVVLYYFNQMSTKEIAKVMNCLEGTVKSRLYTARANLKHTLAEEGRMWRKEIPS